VLFAFVSGSLWGIFAVLTKGVVHRLGEGGWTVLGSPELYAWLLVAVGGFAWEQSAFRAGALTASMPTLQVSQPVVAALLGVVVLGETLNTGRGGMVALIAAALVMAAATAELARVDAVATSKRVEAALGGRATGLDSRLATSNSSIPPSPGPYGDVAPPGTVA
jgi:hypothetical protein